LDVTSEVACPLAFSVFTAPTCDPPDTHPCPAVTCAGLHRKNVTVPVGVTAPAAPVTVTESLTDVPSGRPDVFGLDVVATVGVAGLTVSWADPDPPPFSCEVTPIKLTFVTGSVQMGPPPVHGGLAGLEGTFNTLRVRFTVHVLAGSSPVAGPSVIVDAGVSVTSPVAGSGPPIAKLTPAHGGVPAAPFAVSTEKTPGSSAPGGHTPPPEVTLQDGVRKRETRLTFSLSFGAVDRLMTVRLALMVVPTVTAV
jgi:hypothetical protein